MANAWGSFTERQVFSLNSREQQIGSPLHVAAVDSLAVVEVVMSVELKCRIQVMRICCIIFLLLIYEQCGDKHMVFSLILLTV